MDSKVTSSQSKLMSIVHLCCWWVLLFVKTNPTFVLSCLCLSFVSPRHSLQSPKKRKKRKRLQENRPKPNLCSRKSVPVQFCFVCFFWFFSPDVNNVEFSVFCYKQKLSTIDFMKINAIRRTFSSTKEASGQAFAKLEWKKSPRKIEKDIPRRNF